MDRMGLMRTLGLAILLGGLVLAFVPRYGPTPAGEPVFLGTYWALGLPLAIVGLLIAVVARRLALRNRPSQ